MTSNETMYTAVMEKLNFEPRLDASNITISIQGDHDIIVLGGKVSSYNEKFIAEQAVKNLAHVRGIANEIEVCITTENERSDVDIAKEITKLLKTSTSIPSDCIQVVIKDGVVTLSGEINWQYQKSAAYNLIRDLKGIKSIINKIKVKSAIEIDPDKVKESITKEFERHARLDSTKIEVTVEGNKIILKGKLNSFREIDDAEEAAWSAPGVEMVENLLMIG